MHFISTVSHFILFLYHFEFSVSCLRSRSGCLFAAVYQTCIIWIGLELNMMITKRWPPLSVLLRSNIIIIMLLKTLKTNPLMNHINYIWMWMSLMKLKRREDYLLLYYYSSPLYSSTHFISTCSISYFIFFFIFQFILIYREQISNFIIWSMFYNIKILKIFHYLLFVNYVI